MKFHTKFRPGDLVRDKITHDEGIIVTAQAIWCDRDGMMTYRDCTERKPRLATYIRGHYGVRQKTFDGSLNGWWYEDNQMELVKKGFLH